MKGRVVEIFPITGEEGGYQCMFYYHEEPEGLGYDYKCFIDVDEPLYIINDAELPIEFYDDILLKFCWDIKEGYYDFEDSLGRTQDMIDPDCLEGYFIFATDPV